MFSSPNFPDPALCKTQRVVNDFWECLVDHSDQAAHCCYALEFGYSLFCKHPDKRTFDNRMEQGIVNLPKFTP